MARAPRSDQHLPERLRRNWVDRPVAPGDVIHARARIGGRGYESDWIVAEYVHPTRVVLRGGNGRIQSTYGFTSEGAVSRFQRGLEFEPDDLRESAP